MAEGGGLLNRCRGLTPTVSSNLIPSANNHGFLQFSGQRRDLSPHLSPFVSLDRGGRGWSLMR